METLINYVVVQFGCVYFLLFLFVYLFVFYLIDCLFTCLSFFVIHSFFPHSFTCLRLVFSLSFPPSPCLFSPKLLPLLLFSVSLLSFLSTLSKFVQRRAQFDSVSLVIQGSMEGELNLMDNLSGSICHYYALPPKPSKHSPDKKVNNHENDDSHSHIPAFHASSGSYFSPPCRAAQVVIRKFKLHCSRCCSWIIKNKVQVY